MKSEKPEKNYQTNDVTKPGKETGPQRFPQHKPDPEVIVDATQIKKTTPPAKSSYVCVVIVK